MLSAVRFTFHPHFGLSVVFIACFSALVYLGIWQLQRADEKQQILVTESQQQQQRIDITDHSTANLVSGQRVSIRGSFDSQYNFLLDNQIHHRQFGYLLLTPFYNNDRSAVYITVRGWLKGSLDRRVLPQIPTNNSVTVNGAAVSYPDKSFALADDVRSQQWPAVVQTKEFENYQQYFDVQNCLVIYYYG